MMRRYFKTNDEYLKWYNIRRFRIKVYKTYISKSKRICCIYFDLKKEVLNESGI